MSGLSGSNAITGDFSFGIEGVLYRGHEPIEYVKEVTVSGNFFQIINQIADFKRCASFQYGEIIFFANH